MPKPKKHDERRAHLTPPFRCPNCFYEGFLDGQKKASPAVYVDLMLWTMRWYHEYMDKVMPDTTDSVALHKVVVACSKDLLRLKEKYQRP